MQPISVLFTNNTLGPRGGSEMYVRDVALELLRRGHRPTAFSLVLGDVAAELRRATIPVLDDITRLGEPPDVIHGHHHLETLIAVLAFPGTPVVNFCHGWVPWEEKPLHHPAVRRYVAVDEVCVDRLVREEGLAPGHVELLLNFVDLRRFRPRPPLPARPARALVLSNAATTVNYTRAIAAACQDAGIALDIVGLAAGNPSNATEDLLPAYDLVFAKGRTVLEALAVGCATVLADGAGAGPLVTPANYAVLRNRNFGIRALSHAHEVAWYREQIAQYCARGAADVSARVRADADMMPAIDRLLKIYAAAMATPSGPGDPSRAAAIHCSRIARPLKEAHQASVRLQTLAGEIELTRRDLELTRGELDLTRKELDLTRRELGQTRGELDLARRELEQTRGELEQMRGELDLARPELEQMRGELGVVRTALREQSAALAESRSTAIRALQERAESEQARLSEWQSIVALLERQVQAGEKKLSEARSEVHVLQREVARFRQLPTLRIRDAVLATPVVGPVLRAGARRLAKLLGQA